MYRPLAEKVLTDLKTSKQLTQDVQEMIAGKAVFNNLAFGRQITPIAMEDLRSEAIKWVKELELLEQNPKEYTHWILMKRILHHHITNTKQLRLWIKYFFNLNSEDLKDIEETKE